MPGGDADPAGEYPTRCRCWRTDALGAAVLARRHHRLPGVAPDDQRRPHVQSMWDKRRYATHVVSNLTFDPEVLAAWVAADAQARDHHAAAARHPRPGRPHQAAGDGHQDRGRRVDPVPGQAQGDLRAPGGSRRLHRRAVPREGARPRSPRQMLVEGLHVFTFNQVAATEAWRGTCWDKLTAARGLSSSSSAASSRPSPVSMTVRGSPIRAAAASASARSSASAPGPATPPACSAGSSPRAAPGGGPGRARGQPCARTSGPGSR